MSIEVRNLRKSFGNSAAVAGIDLDVPEGEMLVLLGPSGCGKTTTMRCIAGLETPDRGKISIDGRTVFDNQERINIPVNRRHVGMVFQSYAIWPHMTVFENVAFSLEMEGLGRSAIRTRVDKILELVGLEGFEERGASYLSGGQMQRVALARSLVMRPSVLLFDEPLSNLDARLRDHLRVQLREIQTQLKITSIYVTHDQREALALADQIMMMQEGEVLQMGDPVSLYNGPKTSEIAEFLGYSNIFEVNVVGERDGLCQLAFCEHARNLDAAFINRNGDRDLTACVRPDDVSIKPLPVTAGGDESSGVNAIAGEVILASFMGSHMQYRVRAGEHEIWEILCPEVNTEIRLGSNVLLEIDPAKIHVLPKQ